MGYCIELINYNFKIKKGNINKAFKALQDFAKTKDRLMWVIPQVIINTEDFYKAFKEIRYPLITDENGDYILDYFDGEKLGNDKEILNSIAKYIEPNSYIEFKGEDEEKFSLYFNGKTCEEIFPKINMELN